MLLHAVEKLKLDVDYMVGAQLEGYDCMVKLSKDAKVMILEGDEYLSSPIDRRPKFHLYKPHVAIISGIAWDHINVFPTFENYVGQFDVFCSLIEPNGTLIFNEQDEEVARLGEKYRDQLNSVPYKTPEYSVTEYGTLLKYEGKEYELQIFGAHNLQNLMGAMNLARAIGISPDDFFRSMSDFKGAGKRLQKVAEKGTFVMFKDFAHSPSKLKATTRAVKEQYADRKVIACMELHTFSSLKKEFLPHYQGAMEAADCAIVYYSPSVVAHKKLEPISRELVKDGFGGTVRVANETHEVLNFIHEELHSNSVLLMMSSGNFDGIDYEKLGMEIVEKW
jgi:UDP-N-acetylmuramate: L-alanyl-gamma-D-glutamyl-meso-diaminopimelate ligase